MKTAMVPILVLVVCGCANLRSPITAKALGDGKPYWFTYTAERRGALVLNTAKGIQVCSEPFPDVGLNLTSKIAAAATYQGAKGEIDADFASSVVELAGRTQIVLVLREALYRLCEQIQNGNITDSRMIERMYTNVLNVVNNFPAQASLARSPGGERSLMAPMPERRPLPTE